MNKKHIVPITMSVREIKAFYPCVDGWKRLLTHLGKTTCDDEQISFETILDSNGIRDATWCMRVKWFEHKSLWMQFINNCVSRANSYAADAARYTTRYTARYTACYAARYAARYAAAAAAAAAATAAAAADADDAAADADDAADAAAAAADTAAAAAAADADAVADAVAYERKAQEANLRNLLANYTGEPQQ